jgi:hypothetical protein
LEKIWSFNTQINRLPNPAGEEGEAAGSAVIVEAVFSMLFSDDCYE